MQLNADIAALYRLAGAHLALCAGEIAHRSSPELGSGGLAQGEGFRTPVEMLKVTTGITARDAVSAIRAGRIIHDTQTKGLVDPVTNEVVEPLEPWLDSVGRALTKDLSVAAADAIRTGLGRPSAGVPVAALAGAAEVLCDLAATLDPDRLFQRARAMRDELDAAGVAEREEARRARRSLHLTRKPDGMGRLVWELDPESLAVVVEVYDRLTSPRRGGPRFGPTEVQGHADRIVSDLRTTEQLASDGFVQLLQSGAAADPSPLLGTGTPAVRILVTERALEEARRPAHASESQTADGSSSVPFTTALMGWIEGQHDPVSMKTVERLICTGATQAVTIGATGQPLDVGREQRLFTTRQRIALAARDGGCRWNDGEGHDCERPPSWSEAHHIRHWARDNGETNVADGILLCKYHHLLLHNAGWEIVRDGSSYWLVPPKQRDPAQKPRALPTKSAALRHALRPEPSG
jgi:hypothetical protein